MLLNAELYVKDQPGQLVGSLEPISLVDGNIIGVVHDREKMVNHRILVSVTFEVANAKMLEKLKGIWKSRDIIISEMGSVYQTITREFLMVGKFNATYIENLLEEAATLVNLESTDVSYSFANRSTDKRTAMITAEVRTKQDLNKLDEFFSEACRKDNMLYIRGL